MDKTKTRKKHTLRHPLNGVVGEAEQMGFWMKNGRYIGMTLQFPCGHTAKLSFNEIRKLQEGTSNE